MDHIVLLLVVFFLHATDTEAPPQHEMLDAPAGVTLAQCEAEGKRRVALYLADTEDHVSDAQYVCLVEKQHP